MNEKLSRSLQYECRKRQILTSRDKFFDTLNVTMPWGEWLAMIEPHWSGNGRGAEEQNTLLRMYLIQRCFNISDEDLAAVVYDSDSMMSFAGIDLDEGAPPDEDVMRDFRRALENQRIGEKIVEEMNRLLKENGKIICFGKITSPVLVKKAQKNEARG